MGKRKRNKGERRSENNDRPGRHPPHLRGKQIGLFYAQKSKEKKIQHLKRPVRKSFMIFSLNNPLLLQLGAILLSTTKKQQIQAVLNSTSFKNLFVVDDGSYEHVKDSHFKRDFMRVISETIDEKLTKTPVIISDDSRLDATYYEEFVAKQQNQRYMNMLEKRKKLPAHELKNEILKVLEENQVLVISGETGCGKTTQVPQFILDDFLEKQKGSGCRILCTQPRRISAISVAQRVADERAENLGQSVGYHIRMER